MIFYQTKKTNKNVNIIFVYIKLIMDNLDRISVIDYKLFIYIILYINFPFSSNHSTLIIFLSKIIII